MLGQNHGLPTAHFSVKSGCDLLESRQIIVLTQCSRYPLPQRHWRFTKQRVLGGLRLYEKAAAFTGNRGSQVLRTANDIKSHSDVVFKTHIVIGKSMLCYKWILTPLSLWALVIDFKGGQDLSFRFWKTDTQLPFLQSTHKVRKKH